MPSFFVLLVSKGENKRFKISVEKQPGEE